MQMKTHTFGGQDPIVVQCACQAETEVRWSNNNKNSKKRSSRRHSATECPTHPSPFKRACGPWLLRSLMGGGKKKGPARDRYLW